jgi:cytoskeletal protein CcmA (bactofilin family)
MVEDIIDDVYIYGNTVNISNNIDGDLTVVGFRLNMNGDISQDVLAAGGSMDFGGPVKGDLRAVGGTIGIDCDVDDDVIIAGGFLDIDTRANIGGDLTIIGQRLLIDGNIKGRVIASGSAIVLSGYIGDDVEIINVESLKITDTAEIDGDIFYSSEKEAEIELGAEIKGKIKFNKIEEDPGLMEVLFSRCRLRNAFK